MASNINIFDLTEMGIRFLQQESYGDATTVFHCALLRLKGVISYTTAPSNTPKRRSNESSPNVTISTASLVRSIASAVGKIDAMDCDPTEQSRMQQSLERVSQKEPSSSNNPFAVFDQAFTLSFVDSEEEICSLEAYTESLASACLLFNLALTVHKKAIAIGSTESYRHALDLYEKSVLLVQCFEDDDDDVDCEGIANAQQHCLVLIMALFNNMGQIYAEFYQFDQITQCMATIQAILESEECDSLLLDSDEFFFFLWNASLFPEKPVWLAPAA